MTQNLRNEALRWSNFHNFRKAERAVFFASRLLQKIQDLFIYYIRLHEC
jgi:hypothetical protein